jgi:hypothetical protein
MIPFSGRIYKRILFLLAAIGLGLVLYKLSGRPFVVKELFPEKIWVHRVNSLVKIDEIINEYSGLELDLVWTGKEFDVNHPPATSIGLSLDKYLEHNKEIASKGIWLDFKNLNRKNQFKSASHLDSLLKIHSIPPKNVYVESYFPEFLKAFHKIGVKTSYYLPGGLHKLKGDSLKNQLSIIKQKLRKNEDVYISAPFVDYYIMQQYFPDRKKLLWHLGGIYGPGTRWKIYRALTDPNVEVLLRPFESVEGDR